MHPLHTIHLLMSSRENSRCTNVYIYYIMVLMTHAYSIGCPLYYYRSIQGEGMHSYIIEQSWRCW